MKKNVLMILLAVVLLVVCSEEGLTANYPLEIIQPQEGLNTNSRYYKAYPGIEYKVPIGVFGGAYPFTYELINFPSGMTIDSNIGIITWSNPTESGSPHNVTVQVTDAESSVDSHSWTITVTTSGFIFLDAINGSHGGDGTIGDPFMTMVDIYRGTDYASRLDNTYANNFVYFRGGTYDIEGYFEGTPGSQQYAFDWRGHVKPVVWLEYPGEEAIIDHDRTASGAYLRIQDRWPNDLFMHGIRFQGMRNHAIRTGGSRHVFFECEFDNLGPGADGANSSFLMYASSGGTQGHHYPFIKNNTFNDLNIGAFIKTYSTYYIVIEGNTFANGTGSPLEGIALKAYDTYASVRANSFDGYFGTGAINGNWNSGGNFDISFNKMINAPSNFSSNWCGALTLNYHGTTTTPVYVYRNTFEGTVTLRRGNTGDGPFIFYDNVIVNENSGTPTGSHISHTSDVSDSSIVVIRSSPHGNLVGNTSDSIIDVNGNLTEAYSVYLGIKGYQLASTSDTTPPTRSNPQPTGELPYGTTDTIISLQTNENTICKYSTTPNTEYADMESTFTNTDSSYHSTLVTGLEDSNDYTYCVRCQDDSGNANTDDFLISFSVDSAFGIDSEASLPVLKTGFMDYASPNPSNPSTIIRYSIAEPCNVQIKIYNHLGQKVCTLIDEKKIAGQYKVMWDATDEQGKKISSGIYFCHFSTGDYSAIRKLLLIR